MTDQNDREKIARWLWCQEAGYTWSDDVVNNYETELAKESYGKKADQILSLIEKPKVKLKFSDSARLIDFIDVINQLKAYDIEVEIEE